MSHLYWLQAISLSPPQLPNPINFSPKPTHTHTHILKSVSSFLLSSSRTSLFLSFSLHIHINTSHSPFSSAFSQSRWLRCPHTHSPTHLLWSLHPVLPLPSRNRTPLKKHTSAARLCHSHYHSNIYIATARLTPQSEKKKYTQPLFGYQTWRCIRNERCSVPAICLWFCNGGFFFYTQWLLQDTRHLTFVQIIFGPTTKTHIFMCWLSFLTTTVASVAYTQQSLPMLLKQHSSQYITLVVQTECYMERTRITTL